MNGVAGGGRCIPLHACLLARSAAPCSNDQNHYQNNATWAAAFIATYTDFLVNVTGWFGGNTALPIFVGHGPITHDYAPWVAAAVAGAQARGLSNLHILNYTTELDGCGHPGWVGHQEMFEIASPVVASVLGW